MVVLGFCRMDDAVSRLIVGGSRLNLDGDLSCHVRIITYRYPFHSVCAAGAGTHVAMHNSSDDWEANGWPLAPPRPGVCSNRGNDAGAKAVRHGGRQLVKALDLAKRGRQAVVSAAAAGGDEFSGGIPSLSLCTCRICPADMSSAGGDPEKAVCFFSFDPTAPDKQDAKARAPSPAVRKLYPIPTPGPAPIKAPYKGFYKDLASISNYIGSITVSWGKAIDQRNKAAFDLQRLELFSEGIWKNFVDNPNNKASVFLNDLEKLRLEKGIQVDPSGTLFRNTAFEGKLIKTVMSITSLLSISFTIVDIIQSATTKDPTQVKLDFIVNTVAQINGTVNETLEQVKGIQVRTREKKSGSSGSARFQSLLINIHIYVHRLRDHSKKWTALRRS